MPPSLKTDKICYIFEVPTQSRHERMIEMITLTLQKFERNVANHSQTMRDDMSQNFHILIHQSSAPWINPSQVINGGNTSSEYVELKDIRNIVAHLDKHNKEVIVWVYLGSLRTSNTNSHDNDEPKFANKSLSQYRRAKGTPLDELWTVNVGSMLDTVWNNMQTQDTLRIGASKQQQDNSNARLMLLTHNVRIKDILGADGAYPWKSAWLLWHAAQYVMLAGIRYDKKHSVSDVLEDLDYVVVGSKDAVKRVMLDASEGRVGIRAATAVRPSPLYISANDKKETDTIDLWKRRALSTNDGEMASSAQWWINLLFVVRFVIYVFPYGPKVTSFWFSLMLLYDVYVFWRALTEFFSLGVRQSNPLVTMFKSVHSAWSLLFVLLFYVPLLIGVAPFVRSRMLAASRK